MSLSVSDKGGNIKEIEPGTYMARCIKLIDIGTQRNEFQGEERVRKQIMVMWELPTEIIEEPGDYHGMPRSIACWYTASLNEKANLRKDLEAWRGRAFTEEEKENFDLINILGAPCMLSIIHSEKGKAKVGSVSKLAKGMSCPPQINPSVSFDLDKWFNGDKEQSEIFNNLSEGIQGLIKKSDEYKMAMNEVSLPRSDEDVAF